LDLFLKRAVRGRVRLELEHRGLDRAVTEIEKSSNRLSFAFIISAIVVSSAMIFVAGVGPEVLGYSALGIVGFVVAVFLGLWLAVAMLRSGRL
jgi:ubiquinone biosynthesis protein